MYIQTPEVKEIAAKLFPGYSGHKYKVETFQGPMRLTSCWSGGSCNKWGFLNFGTGKTGFVPENGTPFTEQLGELTELPFNCVLGCHVIYCGKDLGITLYVHPDNINRYQVENSVELTRDEKIVLVATRSLKSSYAGIKNYRFHKASKETGITLEQWETAKASCTVKGLLNKAGAITDAGRNVAGTQGFYQFRAEMAA